MKRFSTTMALTVTLVATLLPEVASAQRIPASREGLLNISSAQAARIGSRQAAGSVATRRGSIGRAMLAPVRAVARAIGTRLVQRGAARIGAGRALASLANAQSGPLMKTDKRALHLRGQARSQMGRARALLQRGHVTSARREIRSARGLVQLARAHEEGMTNHIYIHRGTDTTRLALLRPHRRADRLVLRGLRTQARGVRLVQFGRQ